MKQQQRRAEGGNHNTNQLHHVDEEVRSDLEDASYRDLLNKNEELKQEENSESLDAGSSHTG